MNVLQVKGELYTSELKHNIVLKKCFFIFFYYILIYESRKRLKKLQKIIHAMSPNHSNIRLLSRLFCLFLNFESCVVNFSVVLSLFLLCLPKNNLSFLNILGKPHFSYYRTCKNSDQIVHSQTVFHS